MKKFDMQILKQFVAVAAGLGLAPTLAAQPNETICTHGVMASVNPLATAAGGTKIQISVRWQRESKARVEN
jgi:hypothetical protein